MLVHKKSHFSQRRGAHLVEFAVVAPLTFLLLFGILEWSRYVMTINVTQNAVREGARYSLARTNTDQTGVTPAMIQQDVANYLDSAGFQLTSTNIYVYKTNLQGQPIDLNGNVITYATAISSANQANWCQTPFGGLICVQVSGTYTPIVPGVLEMGAAFPVTATAIMNSEGN
jgi:Flp pilus assembly protein TadG